MIGARRGSPLAVGYGEDGELYLIRCLALALTNRLSYLEEGDWVVLRKERQKFMTPPHQPVERSMGPVGSFGRRHRQGQFSPFHAEGDSRAARSSVHTHSCVNLQTRSVTLPDRLDLVKLPRLTITACGTMTRRQLAFG